MDKKKQLEKWNKTLEKIKADLTPISYDTWFKPLVFNSVDETTKIIYFEVFNALLVKVINERYLKLLETNIQEVFGEPGDPFDPNLHNAVLHTEDKSLGENEIAEVMLKGYKKGDRIIRYAMVRVAN